MYFLFGFLFIISFLVVGFILVIGTYRKWPLLLDPPPIFEFHVMLKRKFGVKVLIIHNYIIGFTFIIVTLIGICNLIFKSRP